ncbi:hypothetical protein [Leisingera sp.]|uniref:hypothetical protein n=1 Tax=Leisingera sp. TaxID=1879318 RepID=UPI002B266235|nr:hypothetical protein [Leisingera sp.]
MDTSDWAGNGPLANFNRRYGSLELLLRYCRGHVRAFRARLLFMTFAFAVLGLAVPPVYALLAFALAVAGDVADCLLLRRADHLVRRGMGEGGCGG